MSIVVTYYSFSPTRADKGWAEHGEQDIKKLKDLFVWGTKYNLENEMRVRVTAEVSAKFEPARKSFREEIFTDFKSRGLYVPKHEWEDERPEDLMEYLANYGCVYDKGVVPPQEGARFEMLDKPTQDAYYALEKKCRDEIAEEILKGNAQRARDLEGAPEEPVNKQELMHEFRTLDLNYGSVQTDAFEEPKLEYLYLGTICEVYGLRLEDGVPTKAEWIRLFTMLSGDKTKLEASKVAKQADAYDKPEEWEGPIIDYLTTVRYIVEDLKATDTAMFYREYDGGYPGNPSSVDKLLTERCLKHYEQYKKSFTIIT